MKSLIDIADETARARELHGSSFEDGNDDKKLRRLGEEYGEVARAIEEIELFELEYAALLQQGVHEEHLGRCRHRIAGARDHLRAELVQVASLAIRWIDQMDGAQ